MRNMWNFIWNGILWVMAMYGMIEILKTIIHTYTYTNLKSDGIYVIIATKNQEKKIEGFVRSLMFRLLYGKEESVNKIIVTDLDSKDETPQILEKLSKDYDCIKMANWKDCKEVMDSVDKA